MAALMSTAPGPIPVHQPPNGTVAPLPVRQQAAPTAHSARAPPTSDPSTTRAQRTARVQPAPGANAEPHLTSPASGRTRPTTSAGAGAAPPGVANPNSAPRHRQTASQPNAIPPQQQSNTSNARAGTRTSNQPNPTPDQTPSQPQARPTTAPGDGTTSARNSTFPHAFERWEMLSSRWEGLTGYWISKLEQNKTELSHLPLEQSMSRQITDLSAAGANLFHAVVELQRLRASSERKFQRWFFETRADQERSREMSSELEATLRVERQKRADAMATISRLEKEKSTAEKLVEECRRELLISREECRRAWEELGRREQEERERTNSLRDGHPTLVGGVQVLPMPMPGVPSRSGSTKRQQPSPQQQQYTGASEYGDEEEQEDAQLTPKHGSPHPHHEPHMQMQSPVLGIPLQQYPQTSTAGATATSTSNQGTPPPVVYPPPQAQPPHPQAGTNQFYQQQHASIHNNATEDPTRTYTPGAESFVTNEELETNYRERNNQSVSQASEMSDEEAINKPDGSGLDLQFQRDAKGHLVLDAEGNPIVLSYRYSGANTGRFGDQQDDRGYHHQGGYNQGGYDNGHGGYDGSGSYDYTGWERIQRHHHPTRLSDVVEEEERTHTSVSDR